MIYIKTESAVLTNKAKDYGSLSNWNKFSIWACSLNSEKCIDRALSYFKKWIVGETYEIKTNIQQDCVKMIPTKFHSIMNIFKKVTGYNLIHFCNNNKISI